ncbi:MAG: hypothetical protein RR185_08085 [Angelakisella sp.]
MTVKNFISNFITSGRVIVDVVSFDATKFYHAAVLIVKQEKTTEPCDKTALGRCPALGLARVACTKEQGEYYREKYGEAVFLLAETDRKKFIRICAAIDSGTIHGEYKISEVPSWRTPTT